MIRLALRAAPLLAMVFPVALYERDRGEAEVWLRWRAHTYEARSLAERVARDAVGPPMPARVAADIDALAEITGDNPRQVAAVAAMRRALAMGPDYAAIARLAEGAAAEEDRLLPIRSRLADASRGRADLFARSTFAAAFLVAMFQAFADWLGRRSRPSRADVAAARDRLVLELGDARLELVEKDNLASFLRLKLSILVGRMHGEEASAASLEQVDEIRAELARVSPPPPGGDE